MESLIFRIKSNKRFSFAFTAAVVPAVFIVLASYAECNRMLVVAYFTLAMGFMGTFYPGMKVNPLDLSPNYAGSLMAVTNGIGALAGICAPNFVGVMAPNVSQIKLLIFSFDIFKLKKRKKSKPF